MVQTDFVHLGDESDHKLASREFRTLFEKPHNVHVSSIASVEEAFHEVAETWKARLGSFGSAEVEVLLIDVSIPGLRATLLRKADSSSKS